MLTVTPCGYWTMRDRGWLTMHGDTFVEFLQRAADGEDVGILEAEFHANCEVEDYRES